MTTVTFTHSSISGVRQLADSIKDNLETSVAGTTVSINEKVSHAAYNANLPEGVTPDMINQLSKYHQNYSKAGYVAVTETAAAIFNQHADVDMAQARIGFFAETDHSDMTVKRSHTSVNNFAKDGEPKTVEKFMHVIDSIDMKSPSFKTLKNAISAEFKEKYVS